jgi:hypothetical protein
MFGFLIKKSFFDLWDHFLPAIMINLGFVALLAIPVMLPGAVGGAGAALSVAVLLLGISAVFVYFGGVTAFARDVTDYQSLEWRAFLVALRGSAPAALVLALIMVGHVFLISVAFPVYSSLNNVVGLFALAILFWMSVIWWMTAPFYLPVRTRLTPAIVPALKKSFIVTFDNAAFVIGVSIGAVVIAALSFFTAFLIPGIAGLAIWYQAALKLRLYKYDYLEANPEADRKSIPWDALLYDDRDRVGKRTLRGMIFPWKE